MLCTLPLGVLKQAIAQNATGSFLFSSSGKFLANNAVLSNIICHGVFYSYIFIYANKCVLVSSIYCFTAVIHLPSINHLGKQITGFVWITVYVLAAMTSKSFEREEWFIFVRRSEWYYLLKTGFFLFE